MKTGLDHYVDLQSWLHQWEPRCKLIGLTALIFAFAGVKNWRLIPYMVGITLALYALSQLPLKFWLTQIRYPGLFLLGMAALLPFLAGETVLWSLGGISLRQEGLLALVLISARFLSIITVVLILLGSTPFLTLVHTLRALGVPALLTDMLLLVYRYLFETGESLTQMERGMKLRGFSPRLEGKSLQRLASLTGTLFVRSYERSERVYQAMRTRGYGAAQRRANCPPSPGSVFGLVLSLSTALGFAVAGVILG